MLLIDHQQGTIKLAQNIDYVVDAGGSPTQVTDAAAILRMDKHGVTITSTNQVMGELAADWASKEGNAIQRIMYEESLKPMVEGTPRKKTAA